MGRRAETGVQRLRPLTPVRARGARLLMVACVVLCERGRGGANGGDVYPDPLAPNLQTDPRHPPRFQQFIGRRSRKRTADDIAFTPTAGVRRRQHRLRFHQCPQETKPKPKTPQAEAQPMRKRSPSQTAAAIRRRPTRRRRPATICSKLVQRTRRAAAAPPGTPPVSRSETQAAAEEAQGASRARDPYAPLGIRAGAFDLFPAVELSGGYGTNPGQAPTRRAPPSSPSRPN